MEHLIPLVTGEEMLALEQAAMQQFALPSLVLMERAGLALLKELPADGRIAIVCGTGNNGADGLCLARLLAEQGRASAVYFDDRLEGTAELMHQKKRLAQFPMVRMYPLTEFVEKASKEQYDVYVDALLGLRLNRPCTGLYEAVISCINAEHEKGRFVLSVDIPTGVQAESGKVLGAAVMATKTVTFTHRKLGQLLYPGRVHCGELVVASIGMPLVEPGTHYSTMSVDWKQALPARLADSHKGTYGTVLVIAGSKEYPGAASLCVKAAYRSGAGIVRLLAPKPVAEVVYQTVPEAIGVVLATDAGALETERFVQEEIGRCRTVVIGPGLSTQPFGNILLKAVFAQKKPCILDADAINLLSLYWLKEAGVKARIAELAQLLPEGTILTPHPKELAGLLGISVAELCDNRLAYMELLYAQSTFVVVAKDACTIVASGEGIYCNASGNQGMSTGGCGDVLAGICGAFRNVCPPHEAAVRAVYVHGLLGDFVKGSKSGHGVMAGDLIEACGTYF